LAVTNKHFIDWEAQVFGFGYGTGESPVLFALEAFLDCCKPVNGPPSYTYEEVEQALGPASAWLMINALCHADIIDYGTSSRYGWLSEKGVKLKEFVDQHSLDDLCKMLAVDQDYIHCLSEHCNCEPELPNCKNPLFPVRR
jgi:hypothetical protein